jgi:hypothetical protein
MTLRPRQLACVCAVSAALLIGWQARSADAQSADSPSGTAPQAVSLTSTDVLKRYVTSLSARHGIRPPDASVMTRAELGKFFLQMMQTLSTLPPEQMTDEDYHDIGLLTAEFEDALQVLRGRMTMYLFKNELQPGAAAQTAQVKEHDARLAMLEKVKVSGDFTYAPQSDMGKTIHDTMASNMRGRINFTTKAYEGKADSRLGDGVLFLRLTAASGRFFPRNKYLLSPENDLVDAVSSPFNSGVNEIQLPNLQINNNNSNSVRPTVSMEQMYWSQDLRFTKNWKGVYRLGLQNFGNYFDNNNYSNNESTQFLNTSFVNSVAWRPNYVGPSELVSVERSIFRGKAFLRGTAGILSLASRDYWGAWQGNYEAQFGHQFFNKEGNVRLGFYNANFRAGTAVVPYVTPVDLSPSGLLSIMPGDLPNGHAPAKQSNPTGLYLNLDQKIWKNIGLWSRYALNDKQLGQVYLGGLLNSRQSWSTGIEIPVGSFYKKRPNDVIGIAYGQNSPYNRDGTYTPASPAFVGLNGVPAFNLSQSNANIARMSPGARRAADEKILEAYYRFQLNKNVSISPDFQYYWSPGGSAPQPGIFVVGSRLNVIF